MADNAEDNRHPFDPRIPLSFDYEHSEEIYPIEEHELTEEEIIFLAVRSVVVFLFLVFFLIVFIHILRSGRNHLKSWRLCLVTAVVLLFWLALSLYQDHVDEYFFQFINQIPTRRSIFWCVRNIAHGLSLFLIILLLSHLSDFQHRGSWLLLVLLVVLVPLVYSITVLLIDLYVQQRHSWQWNLGVAAFRVLLYNVSTTALLLAFSPRFCTARLYGTYEERRNPRVVMTGRWIFLFLLLHNLSAVASFGAVAASQILGLAIDLSLAILVHSIIDEIAFFFAFMTVPMSYFVGILAGLCCSGYNDSNNVEMDKIDKIYQEVWTTDRVRISHPPSVPPQFLAVNSTPNGGGVTMRDKSKNTTTTTDRRKRESYLEAVSMGSLEDSGSISSSTQPIDL